MSDFDVIKTGASNGVLTTPSSTVSFYRTFSPLGYVVPGVAKWEDRAAGIAVGFPTLSLSVRQPNGGQTTKVQMRVALPTVEQLSPSTVWTKAYESLFVGEFTLHQRSTAAERLELLDILRCILMTTITASDGAPSDATGSPFGAAVQNYERPY